MKSRHSAGTSSSAKIARTGHSSTQSPQSMQTSGSTYSIGAVSKPGSSFVGWMQSTGQTATQAVSFTPMQGWVITYVIRGSSLLTPVDHRPAVVNIAHARHMIPRHPSHEWYN